MSRSRSNNSGQVAGWIFVGGAAHAAIYSGGAWRDLGVPAGEQLSVLNGTGVVVGEIDASGLRRGFVYQNGVAARLDQGARFMTMARAINAAGKIAGDGQLPGLTAEHALTYDVATSTFASLGVEATGAFSSQGYDINLRGDVVGGMLLNVGPHAFLASGGRV